MHDSILRATGFTLLHDNLVDAFDLPADAARGGAAPAVKEAAAREAAELEMMRRLLMRLERWLARERRLLEASSARPLERAYFVLLDGDKTRVAKVLADAA